MLGVKERMDLKLFGREIIFEEFQRILAIPSHGTRSLQTDRQTDRRTDSRLTIASPRSALASRGKKYFQCATIPSLSVRVYNVILLAVAAFQPCQLAQNSEKI